MPKTSKLRSRGSWVKSNSKSVRYLLQFHALPVMQGANLCLLFHAR
jgi:hypothetical protein